MTNDNSSTNDSLISALDVLLGRGGQTNSHVGNREYRRLVSERQSEYLSARKKEKAVIAKSIVDIVKSNGGRFLKKDSSGVWVDAGDKKAITKTSQALREGLDVRNHCVREKKLFRNDTKNERIVPGKVAAVATSPAAGHSGSSSIVSYDRDSHSLPDLRDEYNTHRAAATTATILRYHPELNKDALKDVCGV